jgi:hypothetical protein
LFAHVADRSVAPLGSPSADRYLFRDVGYEALVADPLGEVERVNAGWA